MVDLQEVEGNAPGVWMGSGDKGVVIRDGGILATLTGYPICQGACDWVAPWLQVTPPESHYEPLWTDVFTGAILRPSVIHDARDE